MRMKPFRPSARRAHRRVSVFAQSLEPRRMLAAVSWDGGGDGFNWTDARNWSTDTLPTAADDVTLYLPVVDPRIVVGSASAASVHSLLAREELFVDSGS